MTNLIRAKFLGFTSICSYMLVIYSKINGKDHSSIMNSFEFAALYLCCMAVDAHSRLALASSMVEAWSPSDLIPETYNKLKPPSLNQTLSVRISLIVTHLLQVIEANDVSISDSKRIAIEASNRVTSCDVCSNKSGRTDDLCTPSLKTTIAYS